MCLVFGNKSCLFTKRSTDTQQHELHSVTHAMWHYDISRPKQTRQLVWWSFTSVDGRRTTMTLWTYVTRRLWQLQTFDCRTPRKSQRGITQHVGKQLISYHQQQNNWNTSQCHQNESNAHKTCTFTVTKTTVLAYKSQELTTSLTWQFFCFHTKWQIR